MKKMKYQAFRIIAGWLLLVMVSVNVFAQSKTEKLLLKKNFYLLYLLEQGGIKPAGQSCESLGKRLREDAKKAVATCGEAACFSNAVQFKEEEIDAVGKELSMQSLKPVWKKLIGQLKASGAYSLFAADPDSAFIRKVWQQDATGVNYILATYVEGRSPIYPKIDSISFAKNDTKFRGEMANSIFRQLPKRNVPFYNIPLHLALDALQVNGRDEAIRYEPLTAGENAAAFKKAATLKWSDYKYSMILVPGLGPETPGVRLDSNGAKRCDSAVVRYRA
ncbi:MAG: hypothetical protein J7578_14735, partial [Chitinophagaceae bacterium]|nr:hypothetical protein [Chitinophagaceae bacterium]